MDSLFRRGEPSIVAKITPFGKGNRKRCDQAAGASGAGPARAVASSALTHQDSLGGFRDSAPIGVCGGRPLEPRWGQPREPKGGHMRSWAAQPSCASTSSASASQTAGCGIDRLAVGQTIPKRLAGFWMNQRPSILDVRRLRHVLPMVGAGAQDAGGAVVASSHVACVEADQSQASSEFSECVGLH